MWNVSRKYSLFKYCVFVLINMIKLKIIVLFLKKILACFIAHRNFGNNPKRLICFKFNNCIMLWH